MARFNGAQTQCSTTLPAKCVADAGAKTVSFKVCSPNLKYDYVSNAANKANAKSLIIADVAMNVGVITKLCQAVGDFTEVPTSAKAGVKAACLEVSCSPATATATGNVAALLNTFIQKRRSSGTGMTMGRASTLPADSRVDPEQTVSGNTLTQASCGGSCPAPNVPGVNADGTVKSSSSSDGDSTTTIIIIIAAVALVVVAGVGVYVATRGSSDTGAPTITAKMEEAGAADTAAVGPAQPEGAVYMKNGVWLDKDDKPIEVPATEMP